MLARSLAALSLVTPVFAQFGSPVTGQCDRTNYDASIAVGSTYAVHTVNSELVITLKLGAFVSRQKLDFDTITNNNGFFGQGATRIVDPRVLYNQYTERFTITGLQIDTVNVPAGNKGIYFAYSASGDPTGSWQRTRTTAPVVYQGANYDVDFSGLGISQSHTIHTSLLFPAGTTTTPFGHLYRHVPTSTLASTPTVTDIVLPGRTAVQFAAPAHSFGAAPWLHVVGVSSSGPTSSIRIGVIRPGFVPALSEWNVTVPAFTLPPQLAPQPNGISLETDDGRIQNAVYRDGFLYACHSVIANNARVVRWYQFQMNDFPTGSAPTLVQSGNVDANVVPGANATPFYPAIAVDAFGGIGMVFGASSSARPPCMYSCGRQFDSPIGQMSMPTQLTWFDASFDQQTRGPGVARWGDYSGICLDPVNPWVFFGSGGMARNGPTGSNGCPINPFFTTHWETWFTSFRSTSNVVNPYVENYGTGLMGTLGVPGIGTADALPAIGTTIWTTIGNSFPGSAAGCLMMAAAPGTGASLFGGQLWVDLASAVQVPFTHSGAETSMPLAIPANPWMIGQSLYLQAYQADSGASQGISFTRGLRLTFGL